MATYQILRVLRILLWSGFAIATVLFALISPTKFKFPNVIHYAPVVTLGLACLVAAVEWIVRWRSGLPVKPALFLGGDAGAEHQILWVLRIVLWGAFLFACILFALVSITKFQYPDVILSAPVVTLALACLVEVFERIVRR
jgi:hypothetical protein